MQTFQHLLREHAKNTRQIEGFLADFCFTAKIKQALHFVFRDGSIRTLNLLSSTTCGAAAPVRMKADASATGTRSSSDVM
jgi:hypothetical protein